MQKIITRGAITLYLIMGFFIFSACDTGQEPIDENEENGQEIVTLHVVTNMEDGEEGSLRQLIEEAAAGDTITFDPGLDGKPIIIQSDRLLISGRTLTIIGRGTDKTIISGDGRYGVFQIGETLDLLQNVTISDLAIIDGYAERGAGIYIISGDVTLDNLLISNNIAEVIGGGITNNTANVTIQNSSIKDNVAPTRAGIANSGNMDIILSEVAYNYAKKVTATVSIGGGIYNSGSLTIRKSYIHNNIADNGAGIVAGVGNLQMYHSTIAYNTAHRGGGLIAMEGGKAFLENCTISKNEATEYGGGVEARNGYITIHFSTVADNTPDDIHRRQFARREHYPQIKNSLVAGSIPYSIDSNGYNLFSQSADWNHDTDIVSEELYTGELSDNGGHTYTIALLEGSPAIDAAEPSASLEDDQRNYHRPVDGGSGEPLPDIGAFEFNSEPAGD